jgi:hypothetical protein
MPEVTAPKEFPASDEEDDQIPSSSSYISNLPSMTGPPKPQVTLPPMDVNDLLGGLVIEAPSIVPVSAKPKKGIDFYSDMNKV